VIAWDDQRVDAEPRCELGAGTCQGDVVGAKHVSRVQAYLRDRGQVEAADLLSQAAGLAADETSSMSSL
jgi:hypothetical protein